MLSYKYRIFILLISVLTICAGIIYAGTTGKIAGRVVDKETGEPLPGVNILVQGTTLGSTTDIEGYYTILQVPPGNHILIVSMVGYSKVTVRNVQVHIDQTSPVDIQMTSEAIEMEDITVVAERNIIKKDVSTSVAAVNPEEIEVLPVTSIGDVVSLQAGIEENFVIRGGQSDELLYQIDGVTLRDPGNNKPITTIALSSIQEVSVERGGFNAEYGQVRSGIINIVSKEGNESSYSGSIQLKYNPPTPKHFGMSVYDPNSMWNRPYLDDAVAWTGTTNGFWDEYTRRQYPNFEGWNSISNRLLSDDNPNNDLSPAAAQRLWMWEHRRRPITNQPDYNIDAGFGGPVPFISKHLGNLRFYTSFRFEREMLLIPLSRDDYQEYNLMAKVNSNITDDMGLMLSGSFGKSYNVAMNADDSQFYNNSFGVNGAQFWNPTDYLRTPLSIAQQLADHRASRIFTESWYSQAEVSHYAISGKLTDFLTPSSFYEVSFEHVNRQYETGPLPSRDTSKIFEVIPGYFVDEAPFGWSSSATAGIGDPDMFFGGHSSQMRDSSKTNSFAMKFDLTSQITNEHLIKTGVELSYYDLNLNYGKVSPAFDDINYVKEHWNPYRISAYVQDKIEMLGFIANIGLRMDLSNPNTEWVDIDPFDESYYSGLYDETIDYPKKKAEVDIAFSPRLGISHPITENSKLYFNYGHFKQLPAYQETFRLGRGGSGAASNIGDPNLVEAKTIAYELGYDHVLFELYLLQIQAFYRDILDVQGYTQFTSERKGIGYFKANNENYRDVRGVEVTAKKSLGDWIRGFVTFTYQVTTNGAFGSGRINDNPSDQRIIDQTTQNVYQQKPVPQPRSRASITLLTPQFYGPNFGGIQPFGDWSLTILTDWRAGEYINYNPNQIREVSSIVQNVQTSDYFNIDLRLNKTFDFNFLTVMLFMDVRNLLNAKRLSGAGFYDARDQQFYFESLHLPKSDAYDNIPGDDRVGEYRKDGIAFQPIEIIGTINPSSDLGSAGVIYWERSSERYMEYVNGSWSQVERSRMDKILEDKAYIDMPNNTSFNFLDPRQIFFGINLSFKL
jgi:outer membrane receptor protein involved in Fe transport